MSTGTLTFSGNLSATFGSYTRSDNESVTPTLNTQGESSGIMATTRSIYCRGCQTTITWHPGPGCWPVRPS